MRLFAVACLVGATVSACSDKSAAITDNVTAGTNVADVSNNTMAADEYIPASNVGTPVPPPAPAHNYQFVEGDLYGYLGAISEDDQKKGVAAPPVVRFRYTGLWNGAHHFQDVSDSGVVTGSEECDVPCVAIKEIGFDGTVHRVGYSPASIIGSAFEDAMNGKLRRSPQPGIIKDGYRFRGGDPGDSSNWQQIAPTTPPQSTPPTSDMNTVENSVR